MHPALLSDHVIRGLRPLLGKEGRLPMHHGNRPRRDELHVNAALVKESQVTAQGRLHLLIRDLQVALAPTSQCNEVVGEGPELRRRGHVPVHVDDFGSIVHPVSLRSWFVSVHSPRASGHQQSYSYQPTIVTQDARGGPVPHPDKLGGAYGRSKEELEH